MNQAIFNPWAAPYLNGFNDTSPDQCQDDDHMYVWPEVFGFQTLAANEERSEVIVLDPDADFRFQGLIWSLHSIEEGTTPGFLYRIQDELGKYICDGFTLCFATPGTLANPWPQFPHVTYAAHQRLQFEIINLADHEQGVQLGFRGMKRFRRVG
jgi:hypothetical protein